LKFLAHCIDVANKKKLQFPSKVAPKNVVSRAINTFLQKRRLDFKFEGTAEQKEEYNKRNGKKKAKGGHPTDQQQEDESNEPL